MEDEREKARSFPPAYFWLQLIVALVLLCLIAFGIDCIGGIANDGEQGERGQAVEQSFQLSLSRLW